MRLHLGETRYPARFSFHRGTIRAKGHRDQECFHENPIKWWYGISWGSAWFFGFVRTGPTEDIRR